MSWSSDMISNQAHSHLSIKPTLVRCSDLSIGEPSGEKPPSRLPEGFPDPATCAWYNIIPRDTSHGSPGVPDNLSCFFSPRGQKSYPMLSCLFLRSTPVLNFNGWDLRSLYGEFKIRPTHYVILMYVIFLY